MCVVIVNLLGACTTSLNRRELLVIVEYCRYCRRSREEYCWYFRSSREEYCKYFRSSREEY